MTFNEVRLCFWVFLVLNGVLWVQCRSQGFFEVHLGSVRFNEAL